MGDSPNSMHAKATALLIRLEGNRRFCSSCQCVRDADSFVKIPTKKGAVLRCGICAQRRTADALNALKSKRAAS